METGKLLKIGLIVFFVFFVPLSSLVYFMGWLSFKNSMSIMLLWIPFMLQGLGSKMGM